MIRIGQVVGRDKSGIRVAVLYVHRAIGLRHMIESRLDRSLRLTSVICYAMLGCNVALVMRHL